jgi:hypothetical protein
VPDKAVKGRRTLRKVLLGFALLVVVLAGTVVWKIGPRNLIGMARYDQRREGDLKVGDAAPDVTLVALDGKTPVRLRDRMGGKPLVLVFGSYT